MKFILYSFLLLVLSPTAIYAESITTGNAYVNTSISTQANDGSVESSTQTNIQSSGESSVSVNNTVESKSTSTTTNKTYKKIGVTVNGEKKVVESNEDGEIKIETGTKTVAPSVTHSPTLKPATPTPTLKPEIDDLGKTIKNWVDKFISDIFSKFSK